VILTHFYPLRSLVAGPFDNLNELPAIERFVRTVVLHDEIAMEGELMPYQPEAEYELSDEEKQAGGRVVITGMRPVLDGYDFFTDPLAPEPVPEIELNPALIEVASQFANAGEGNVYFRAHVECLKRLLGVVQKGGSVLLCGDFGQQTECPPMNFVTDCTATSAPSASGRWFNGVAKVLSTPKIAPRFRDAAQIVSKSATVSSGLEGDSSQIKSATPHISIQRVVSATATRCTVQRPRSCPALASPATP
jgi:hypothetical protein